MNRALAIIIAILIIGGGVWLLTRSGDQAPSPVQIPSQNQTSSPDNQTQTGEVLSGETAVSIEDFSFAPSMIRIKKGTKVIWTNQDSAQHNVVSNTDSPQKGLNGPLLAKGESYSFTFDTVGTYTYHCVPHPSMQATVEVIE